MCVYFGKVILSEQWHTENECVLNVFKYLNQTLVEIGTNGQRVNGFHCGAESMFDRWATAVP